MSIVSIADSRRRSATAQQERDSQSGHVAKRQAYIHEEVVGLLVLQLLNGHAAEMLPVIVCLQRELRARGARDELNDLQILRQLAELDVDGPHHRADTASESPAQLALHFGLRILPTLRKLAVSDGNPTVSERLRHLMLADLGSSRPNEPIDRMAMGQREAQALSLAAHGMTNREIAQRMGIREGTVKKHLSNVFAKLDVTNRMQAVDKARQLGIL